MHGFKSDLHFVNSYEVKFVASDKLNSKLQLKFYKQIDRNLFLGKIKPLIPHYLLIILLIIVAMIWWLR
jgi:hypothetical protein